MYVSNGRLYNAYGKEFVMRGVNVAHAWYPGETQTSINAIADRGANCVRIVLADGTQWGKT
ncbi:glycoside hydrolase family 5 protein, partial [Klebsiella oxytoca]